MDRFYYRAFDLNIASDFELPELPKGGVNAAPAFEITRGMIAAGEERVGWRRAGSEFILWWADVATFAVRAGGITVSPAPECPFDIVRLPLLGPAFAVALQLSGLLVLHGNAVRIGDKAVAMAGDKGCGKSTLTATLLARGHQLLADDVVALRRNADGSFTVLPGFPAMKLWPDTLRHCGPVAIVRQRLLAPGGEKLCIQLDDRHFAGHSAPLEAIHFLDRGDRPEIVPLLGTAAFQHLMLHSYCSRYGRAIFDGAAAASHLRDGSALLRSVRISLVRRSNDFAALASLAELLEGECEQFDSRKVAA